MALSLYVNTFRIVLRVNPDDGNSWSHIYGSLCCLRESLMCFACRKLAINPYRPLPSKCEHSICQRCVGSKAQKECHCKWCSKMKLCDQNIQLRVVLQCYKRMCHLIMGFSIFRTSPGSKLSSGMMRFVSMVHEGAGLEDDYHYKSKFCNGPLKNNLASTVLSKSDHGNNQSVNGHSIKLNDSKSPKVMIKKACIKESMLSNYTDSDVSSDTSVFNGSNIIQECLRSVKKRKSCRCGMATRNPGKLTCCGQRCPCYVGGRACINCRCRGCRNPQKNLISSPPIHSFRSINDVSPEPNNMDVDLESFDDTSSSDSDKDLNH